MRHALIRLLIPLLLLVSYSSQADQYQTPYLWRVVAPGIEGQSSYLFGTIHSAHPELNRLPDVVVSSFQQADAFYGELDMSPTAMLLAAQTFIIADGGSLLSTLSPQRQARINRVLANIHPDLSLTAMAQLKLWALTATLPLLEDQVRHGSQIAMDMRLYQQAQQNGKQVGGLETIDEQADVFESFNEQDNLTMLDSTLEYIEKAQLQQRPIMEETYQAYATGDPTTFDRLLKQQMSLPQPLLDDLLDRLLADRNQRMAERIHKLLQDQPRTSFFFAVGAAHYSEDEGIQKLLAEYGYRVSRVKP
ncbi:MAG: TraB/GumN family protein [Motiliproteus sp.]